ncbi:MAG: hypothetical protein CL915_05790 [Deltaproteobacteria bacterium]|nr:hypothetical protein [Deltaproteobacteria bacterium]
MFFSAIIVLLWSEWQFGYNSFMALKRGMSIAESRPEPLSEPTLVGVRGLDGRVTPDNRITDEVSKLRERMCDLENTIRRARVRLPDVDACAEQLMPIADSVEELLYDIGYCLDFESALRDDNEPEYIKMSPSEGYNPEAEGLSQKPNFFTDCAMRDQDQNRMHD